MAQDMFCVIWRLNYLKYVPVARRGRTLSATGKRQVDKSCFSGAQRGSVSSLIVRVCIITTCLSTRHQTMQIWKLNCANHIYFNQEVSIRETAGSMRTFSHIIRGIVFFYPPQSSSIHVTLYKCGSGLSLRVCSTPYVHHQSQTSFHSILFFCFCSCVSDSHL